jgi:hypothetical protein
MNQPNSNADDFHPPLVNEVHSGRSFPVWIWGCGGGCLVVLMALMGLFVWGANKVQQHFGPEAAWPVVAEVMPFGAEPPAGYTATIQDLAEMNQWLRRLPRVDEQMLEDMPLHQQLTVLRTDPQGRFEAEPIEALMMWRLPAGAPPEELDRLANLGPMSPGVGQVTITEAEPVEFTLQGRPVSAPRFAATPQVEKAFVFLNDPSQVLELRWIEGRERPLLVRFQVSGGGPELDLPARLQEFLTPFDVWGGR